MNIYAVENGTVRSREASLYTYLSTCYICTPGRVGGYNGIHTLLSPQVSFEAAKRVTRVVVTLNLCGMNVYRYSSLYP